jgi:hypothetical protein
MHTHSAHLSERRVHVRTILQPLDPPVSISQRPLCTHLLLHPSRAHTHNPSASIVQNTHREGDPSVSIFQNTPLCCTRKPSAPITENTHRRPFSFPIFFHANSNAAHQRAHTLSSALAITGRQAIDAAGQGHFWQGLSRNGEVRVAACLASYRCRRTPCYVVPSRKRPALGPLFRSIQTTKTRSRRAKLPSRL